MPHNLLLLLTLLAIFCILMPLYIRLVKRLGRSGRVWFVAICAGSGAIFSYGSSLISQGWGAIGLFSYLAFLVLVSLVIRLMVYRRNQRMRARRKS